MTVTSALEDRWKVGLLRTFRGPVSSQEYDDLFVFSETPASNRIIFPPR